MHPRLAWLVAVGFFFGAAALWMRPQFSLARATPLSSNAALKEPGSAAAPSAIFAPTPSCFTWDFLNNTGQDANGLVVHLKGIPSISDFYSGVLNPFGSPDPSSGYNAITDVYTVIYTDGVVPDSGSAEIGICASQPALRLDTAQPSFYWVVSGNPVSPDPLFAGMDFNWLDANHLQVHLYNEQSISVTLLSLAVLLPSGPLSLDDLNDGVVSTLPMASEQVTDPLVLAGGASSTFDVFFDGGGVRVPFETPIVLEAVVATQDDLGDPIHVIAQTNQPFSEDFLPALNK